VTGKAIVVPPTLSSEAVCIEPGKCILPFSLVDRRDDGGQARRSLSASARSRSMRARISLRSSSVMGIPSIPRRLRRQHTGRSSRCLHAPERHAQLHKIDLVGQNVIRDEPDLEAHEQQVDELLKLGSSAAEAGM
jgi:hypothetical protein